MCIRDRQYIAVCDEVENLLANDSGDAEYRACEHVLGEGFDKTETWIIKSMFTANHESRTVEHPETFSSEQEAWNRVKSFALADQNDKEVAEVRYNKDACEAMVIYSDKTFCKFFAEKTDAPETLPLDGNTWEKQKAATLELGTYRLAGYNWTACELINNGKTLVLQSHGVTHGAVSYTHLDVYKRQPFRRGTGACCPQAERSRVSRVKIYRNVQRLSGKEIQSDTGRNHGT